MHVIYVTAAILLLSLLVRRNEIKRSRPKVHTINGALNRKRALVFAIFYLKIPKNWVLVIHVAFTISLCQVSALKRTLSTIS
ncbi:hypothetical protein F5887DRAFT_110472 [Amanita rubescens]|nr:hypothetical protein F5887DRAFT_110472 [Amanita rubescens]